MDTRFLTTFIEVVNTRHFGKAAENLYLTQSAVSARIKLLEEYFQTTLFIRHRNSIQLTPAGEKLLPYARQLCQTLNQAKQELQAQSAEYLVCGATQLSAEVSLSGVLGHLHSNFPQWSVKAEVLSMDNLSRQLHERVIDLAFSTEPLKSEEVVSQELRRLTLGVYCVNLPFEQVDAKQFVSVDWGSKAKDALLAQYPQLRDAKLRTNSLHLALATLRTEGGFAVLPVEEDMSAQLGMEVRLVAPLHDVKLQIYLNTMKAVRRMGLKEVIDSFSWPDGIFF
ncbi:LysR family transcriptional regulator [Alteromonas aestuariivivens]|uniref:LysR family transcriptional regulator n=1 Tax=Alteromonas aestuariivivens TaxID=1938339 RepID=A0A3D8M3Y1_9ALTE|nr:LysR family transcriptional regulator [Alteromonas aestuariivivens]RDV24457.1 LysR family transcriptional regulator [Alteromonas aestuariivivens]